MTNSKSNKKYLFVDTFAINQLTKNHSILLSEWIQAKNLIYLLTSFEIVELYNPNHIQGDRITRFINFLIECDFVIVDQVEIMDLEENIYPAMNRTLPILLDKKTLFKNLSMPEKKVILEKLFTSDLAYVGLKIRDWVKAYHDLKVNWKSDVTKILADIESKKIITKKEIVEFLNLRLCNKIVSLLKKIDNSTPLSIADRDTASKIDNIMNKHDTNKMRGINISSLIFWQKYIKDDLKPKNSDIGDLYHSLLIPYCNIAFFDNAFFDSYNKIKKDIKDSVYTEVLNIKLAIDRISSI